MRQQRIDRERAFKILEALKDPDVRVIGLHGLPGVGKTMIGNVVGKKAWDQQIFDEVVITAISHSPNITEIQEDIADQLGLKFDNVEKNSGRAVLLSQRLGGGGDGGKKTFVILDDIWDMIDLEDIGISFNNGVKAGSIMDSGIRFECDILSETKAMELFSSIVGSAVVNDHGYSTLTKKLLEKCGGLPVAISTIAKALKNTRPEVWQDALTELKRFNPTNIDRMELVYAIIEFSYKYLRSEKAQTLLEHCSLAGEAFNINLSYLVRYGIGLDLIKDVFTLEEARIRVSALVNKLGACSLILSSNNDDTVKMHELIRDVYLSILSKEKRMIVIHDGTIQELRRAGKLDSFTAISVQYNDVDKLSKVLKCPNLKLLLLIFEDNIRLEVPDTFFERTNDLQVLHFIGIRFPSLPSSFASLTNLRSLCFDNCELDSIASISNFKKLYILSFNGSKLMQLPNFIGQLTELRCLDLSDYSKLEVIPANTLSELSSLEELLMGNSFDRWDLEGNVSLKWLINLKSLATLHIRVTDEYNLPKDVFPETLKRFRIFIGFPWDWLNLHECSRTLKLKLNARINLDSGVRTLIRNAEELFVD
ncbi:Disease resistance protein [Corchorus olitorius]|uniref:Disease resistance protein n=1 Tax=Corchorus olitorius TaxID=93759 RepID=A0A1R3HS42_9ROSI|nr:Disease resistance protein [Corchorus olitorius]